MARLPARSAGVIAVPLSLAGCAGLAPDCSAGLDLASKYVARGAVLFDGPALQPALSASVEQGEGTWTAGAWSTVDADDQGGNRGHFTEVDLYVEHERSLGPFTATFGLLRYEYPNTGFAASGEVHAALGCEWEVATPTFHLWYDFEQADGAYLDLELARSIDLAEHWSLELSASAGWMDSGQGGYYFGVEEEGFSDLTTTARLACAASESLGLALTVGFSRVLDGQYRDAVDHADNAWVMVGAELGF